MPRLVQVGQRTPGIYINSASVKDQAARKRMTRDPRWRERLTPGTDVTEQESERHGCSSGIETKVSLVAADDVPRRISSISS